MSTMADIEMQEDGSQDTSDQSGNASSDSEPVELLVSGRERRKTAGNRYDRDMVLEDAEDEDEVTLLFAADQDEVDEEFKSGGSDDEEMSSSDDDNQGPNAGAGEMEGEKEIEKQAKAERTKKRKADLALTSTSGIRKKAKIDPTQGPTAIVKKPSKKKERVTWLPDEKDGRGRASLRKQTVLHREETLARLKESEAVSKKFKALKEQRDREKAKNAPKALTQADRLEEAAKIERRNAKSLNRWEALEKKRNEEQAAKLAALKNRTLEGPVISWQSSKGKWRGPLYARPVIQDLSLTIESLTEPKKRGRKPKGYHEQMAAMREAAATSSAPVTPTSGQLPPGTFGHAIAAQPPSQQQVTLNTQQVPDVHFLSGIHEFATMQPDSTAPNSTNATTPTSTAEVAGSPKQDQQPAQPSTDIQMAGSEPVLTQPNLVAHEPRPETADGTSGPAHPTNTYQPTQVQPSPQLIRPLIQPIPEPPIVEEDRTKNLVTLKNFDRLSDEARHDYSLFYHTSRKSTKPVKHNLEQCPITMQPARYRDPATGIGYSNMFAYRILKELKEHKFTWSGMLGCYVGREDAPVARGVPDGFPGK